MRSCAKNNPFNSQWINVTNTKSSYLKWNRLGKRNVYKCYYTELLIEGDQDKIGRHVCISSFIFCFFLFQSLFLTWISACSICSFQQDILASHFSLLPENVWRLLTDQKRGKKVEWAVKSSLVCFKTMNLNQSKHWLKSPSFRPCLSCWSSVFVSNTETHCSNVKACARCHLQFHSNPDRSQRFNNILPFPFCLTALLHFFHFFCCAFISSPRSNPTRVVHFPQRCASRVSATPAVQHFHSSTRHFSVTFICLCVCVFMCVSGGT